MWTTRNVAYPAVQLTMVNPMSRAEKIRIAVSQWNIRLSAVNFSGGDAVAAASSISVLTVSPRRRRRLGSYWIRGLAPGRTPRRPLTGG